MLMITMKKQIVLWKKLLAASLVAMFAVGLVGCSKEEKLKPEKSSEQASTSQQETASNDNQEQDKAKEEKNGATSTPSDKKESSNETNKKGDYDVTLSNLKASLDDKMLRLDLTCSGNEDGKIYLTDGASTNVGPIDIQKGDFTIYFLLNADNSTTYTLKVEANSGKKAEFTITPAMINAAMTETNVDRNEDD